MLIRASLLSPVPITPDYVGGPQGHDAEGCTAESKTPSWEVVASQMNLRTASGRVQGGTAFVTVRNNVLDYSAFCGGVLTGNPGLQAIPCQAQAAYRRRARYEIETVAWFDPQTFDMAVDQTWFCDDEDPAQPYVNAAPHLHLLT